MDVVEIALGASGRAGHRDVGEAEIAVETAGTFFGPSWPRAWVSVDREPGLADARPCRWATATTFLAADENVGHVAFRPSAASWAVMESLMVIVLRSRGVLVGAGAAFVFRRLGVRRQQRRQPFSGVIANSPVRDFRGVRAIRPGSSRRDARRRGCRRGGGVRSRRVGSMALDPDRAVGLGPISPDSSASIPAGMTRTGLDVAGVRAAPRGAGHVTRAERVDAGGVDQDQVRPLGGGDGGGQTGGGLSALARSRRRILVKAASCFDAARALPVGGDDGGHGGPRHHGAGGELGGGERPLPAPRRPDPASGWYQPCGRRSPGNAKQMFQRGDQRLVRAVGTDDGGAGDDLLQDCLRHGMAQHDVGQLLDDGHSPHRRRRNAAIRRESDRRESDRRESDRPLLCRFRGE